MPVRITVVTPSFNQAKYLEETIRSVLRQRPHVHEYFVVDGGSDDGSVDIIRKHQNQINWWTSEKDRGQADAIQKGFSRATGDVLCWLNSDDVFLPGALERVQAAFEKRPKWDALTGWHVRIDPDSRIVSMHRIPRESPRLARWGMHHVTQQTCFFRRSLYEKAGPIDLKLHCVLDTELWLRMFDLKSKWGHIPRYLAAFRLHPTAKGSSWLELYPREEQWLRQSYPRYCAANLKHHLGLWAYRVGQVLSGRRFAAARDLKRLRGKTIDEAFG